METGEEVIEDVCGYYYASGVIPRWDVDRLREDFPNVFPEGKHARNVRGESEGKDINLGEVTAPF